MLARVYGRGQATMITFSAHDFKWRALIDRIDVFHLSHNLQSEPRPSSLEVMLT